MVDGELQDLDDVRLCLQLALDKVRRVILQAEFPGFPNGLLPVIHETDPAEDDHALHVQPELVRFQIPVVHHRERNLIVFFQRVDLVALFRPMEIDLSAVVDEIDGNPVRVSVLSMHRQDSPGLMLQDLDALFFRELLFPSSHCSEHDRFRRSRIVAGRPSFSKSSRQ